MTAAQPPRTTGMSGVPDSPTSTSGAAGGCPAAQGQRETLRPMTSPQIHAQPVDYLLRELARAKVKNRRLAEQNRKLRESRDRWRDEARAWKWGALRKS